MLVDFVVEKSGAAAQECSIELRMRNVITIAETLGFEEHTIQLSASRNQTRVKTVFFLKDDELDVQGWLRLVCTDAISPWVDLAVPPKVR